MKVQAQNDTRRYEMSVRAAATAATGDRIIDAVVELFWDNPVERITLDEVARISGVSVQTVIRRFGSKDELIAATAARERQRIVDHRNTAPIGDLAGAIEVLFDHYEEEGDRVIKLLADEGRSPALAEILQQGRRVHRDWCSRVFGPSLDGLPRSERKRRLAQFVAVCDVYVWNLLRRDMRLGRRHAEAALVELLDPLTKES